MKAGKEWDHRRSANSLNCLTTADEPDRFDAFAHGPVVYARDDKRIEARIAAETSQNGQRLYQYGEAAEHGDQGEHQEPHRRIARDEGAVRRAEEEVERKEHQKELVPAELGEDGDESRNQEQSSEASQKRPTEFSEEAAQPGTEEKRSEKRERQ